MNTTNYTVKQADMKEKIHIVKILSSNRVKKRGGDKLAQDHASIFAELSIRGGKSAATAIEAGYKAGMRIFKNPLLQIQVI